MAVFSGTTLNALLASAPVPKWGLVLSLVLVLLIGLCVYRLAFHPLSRYPGPPLAACTSFYFMYHISTGYFPQHCEKLFAKYNTDVLRVAPDQLVFNDPQALKDIPGRSDVYRGNFALRVIGFAGTNVSNIRDPGEHRRKRRLMAPGFSNVALAEQEPILTVPIVDKLIKKITEVEGGVVNLSDYFDCVTGDIIGALSFGANFGMLDQLEKHPFLHVLPNVLRLSVIIQCIPQWFRTIDWINRHGPKWTVPKPMRGVSDFAGYHLAERRKRDAVEVDKSGRKDIISIIEAGNEKFKGQPGYVQLGEYEMLGEATNLVTGGGDTVATALTATMFFLGQYPEVYQKLTSEVRALFPTSDSINSQTAGRELKYLDAVLNETMRVSPVLPGPMWRRTDVPISVAGYMVPGKTELGAMRYNIFRNPKAFHDPTSFKPERWIEDMGDNLDACQPFGLGPRTCIGRNIAWMELRLIICKLLWHFDWTPITKTFSNPEYLVQYRGPMLMKAQERKL
ncbi:hypothetical protein A1O1_08014 [Capronia coronata CBS 617.96]|uniref:Cytochrome P450 monooxygenase n=1 Tax=Capronia coronata CBS 617.96 TaxID=1182541 RepID=W9XN42_9EURO|nr:uncharacterized protein A1O1_08014 [Capronia coronata CBS 617.96]EXJ81947.1 hypothetical protein A1O1_08014 [Capronia coronata CBS 617.96]